jgi:hypothetical protein
MPVTLSNSPTYPVPGRDCLVTFAVAATANHVRIYCTAAPDGSELAAKLAASDVTRIQLFVGDSDATWTFRPDAGGVYILSCEEYTVGATTHGGAYKGDPDGYKTETLLSTTAGSITVANRITAEIGVTPDTATLTLYVHGSTIVSTLVDVHGEATPSVSEATSDKARTAARSATVTAALASLSGVSAATALGTPSVIIDDLIVQFNAHIGSASHASADTVNWLDVSFRNPGSPKGVALSANELKMRMTRHMGNDDDGSGFGTAAYHSVGATRGDQVNAIIVAGANEQDPLSQCLMVADLWRAYEAHRVATTFHSPADTTNSADPLPVLLQVYYRFLEALQAASPTAPSTANSGVVFLAHSGGFTVA